MTVNPSIKVVNINFQSIMNKKVTLYEFIFTYKPHIIVGTGTWLSLDISNNEVISAEWNYKIYRKDRPDGYGGVMIAISKQINLHEITALQTNCELLWTQVAIGYSNKLYIGAYYRPHVGDQDSNDELNLSMQKLDETTKDAEIWLIGDFNTPCINWESMSLSTNRTHVASHSSLIDAMQEHRLEQIVNRPTRHPNILDLSPQC